MQDNCESLASKKIKSGCLQTAITLKLISANKYLLRQNTRLGREQKINFLLNSFRKWEAGRRLEHGGSSQSITV